MRTVSVSELKAQLSRYLRDVRRGSEVQIVDRGRPVARLSPIQPAPADDRIRDRLIAAGVVRPGTGDPLAVLEEGPVGVAHEVQLLDALLEDREDRV